MSAAVPRTVAIVLAGAVAQGAFEAGVLKVLAGADLRVRRIVAASSGALNGAYFAAAVRGRRERQAADELTELWRDHASWSQIFHINLGDLLRREGLSDQDAPAQAPARPWRACGRRRPRRHRAADHRGAARGRGGQHRRRAGHDQRAGPHLRRRRLRRRRRARARLHLASRRPRRPFLAVQAPTEVDGIGPSIDGGAVNNTPIKYALAGDLGRQIDAIIVISPTVANAKRPSTVPHGTALIGQLAEMLINERLYRDLREHDSRNRALAALDALIPKVLDAAQVDAVKLAIGWQGVRQVPAVQIRPLSPLPGTAFSGFYEPDLREQYIELGVERATQVLGEVGWGLRRSARLARPRLRLGCGMEPCRAVAVFSDALTGRGVGSVGSGAAWLGRARLVWVVTHAGCVGVFGAPLVGGVGVGRGRAPGSAGESELVSLSGA